MVSHAFNRESTLDSVGALRVWASPMGKSLLAQMYVHLANIDTTARHLFTRVFCTSIFSRPFYTLSDPFLTLLSSSMEPRHALPRWLLRLGVFRVEFLQQCLACIAPNRPDKLVAGTIR